MIINRSVDFSQKKKVTGFKRKNGASNHRVGHLVFGQNVTWAIYEIVKVTHGLFAFIIHQKVKSDGNESDRFHSKKQ
jgi:hypothetical protein